MTQRRCPYCGLIGGFHRDKKWLGYDGHDSVRAWVFYYRRIIRVREVPAYPIDAD